MTTDSTSGYTTRGDTKPYKWGANAQRVVDLVSQGYTDTHIASTIGLSRQRVGQIRKRAGLPRITIGTVCRECGVRFIDRRGHNRCVEHRRKPAEMLDFICRACSTPFQRRESTIRAVSPGHYCSRACRDQGKRGRVRTDAIPKICTECLTEYTGLSSARQSVCTACRSRVAYRAFRKRQG